MDWLPRERTAAITLDRSLDVKLSAMMRMGAPGVDAEHDHAM